MSLPDGRTLSEVAREHTREAVDTLLAVMGDATSPAAARVAAASALLDRGWGRAKQDVAITAIPTLQDPEAARELVKRHFERLKASEALSPSSMREFPKTEGGERGQEVDNV